MLAFPLPLVTAPLPDPRPGSHPAPPPTALRFAPPPWDRHSPDWLRLEDKLPPDHLARRIDQAVEQLDLATLCDAYAGTGSWPHRPDLLLKVVLFEVQQGRHSPGQWYQDLCEHEPCQWLAFGLRPARSRLYAFRDRLGARLDDWHRQLLTQAQALGLTTAERASLDGSTVAANSSRHRLLNQDTLAKRQAQLAQARAEPAAPVQPPPAESGSAEPPAVTAASPVEPPPTAATAAAEPPPTAATAAAEPPPTAATLPAEPPPAAGPPAPEPPSAAATLPAEPPCNPAGPTTPRWLASTAAGQQRQEKRYQHAQEQLQQRHADNQQRPADKRLPLPQVRVSVGDPEAALGLDKFKVFRPLYNVQLMPDLDSGLILAYEVFAQATDSGTLPTMLERYQQATGCYPKKLLTDSSYATALDLTLCQQKGVTVYAPYQENPFTAAKRAARPAKQLPKEAFTWLAEEQTYRCPEGHKLERQGWEYKRRKGEQKLQVFTYRCPAEHCQNCPRQQECTSRPDSGRTVKRSVHEDRVEELKARMQTAEAKQLYKRRSQTVELRFADSKEHRKLRRLSGRGLKRARTEVGLVVLSHNALELLAARTRQTSAEPPAHPQSVPA